MRKYIQHVGVSIKNGAPGRGSGRYPLGSGDRPYQRLSFSERKTLAKRNIREDAYIKGIEEGNVSSKDKFYDDLSHERIIEKGSIAYRTSSKEKESETGGTFVSFDDDSAFSYASWISGEEKKGYITKYEVVKDIRVPSIYKMTETLIDTIMENSEFYNKSMDEYVKRRGIESIEKRKELEKRIVKNPNEALVNMYSSFFIDSSKNIGELGNRIHEKLRQNGYDAVPDLNDVSENFKTPLFVFNRSDVLKKVEKRDISKSGLPSKFDEKYKIKYLPKVE